MSATINDVARAAGVSKATVSRYLNNKSMVREKTAERIRSVIGELNYIPNATARNLAMKQTDKIGVLISGVNSAYWNRILGAFHTYVSQVPGPYEILSLNCDNTVLYNTNKSLQDKIQALLEQRVAGIVLCLRDVKTVDIDYMCGQDVPFVVVQGNDKDERISYVNVDNYTASYEAAQYLIQLGHKSIAYVSGPTDAIYAIERFEGFRDALMSKRLYQRSMTLNGDNQYDDGYWRMKQILSWKRLPTAVMFASDAMAYGGMRAIGEAGLTFPGDISIIGFDGLREEIEVYAMLPPLTSVYQPMTEIGEKAAELIIRRIKDKSLGKNKAYRTIIPTRFVDYGSCREAD